MSGVENSLTKGYINRDGRMVPVELGPDGLIFTDEPQMEHSWLLLADSLIEALGLEPGQEIIWRNNVIGIVGEDFRPVMFAEEGFGF